VKRDELFAQSLGHNTLKMKLTIVALSSVLTGLSGILYAHFLTYIDPSSFGVMDSIFILSMVIIGGQKSPFAAACGAIVLIAIPEGLRFLGMPSALAANLRQIVYGSLLVLVVLLRPEGLFVRNSGNAVRRRVPDAAGV
jgi:branched-chain amino acid transport system permease protein